MATDLLRISDLTTDTPVSISSDDETIALSVADVLKWIAPKAPRHEAMRFLLTCRLCGLNPFRNEAHLVCYKSRKTGQENWSIIISKSGYLRLAENNPNYDGHESGVIIRNVDTKEEREIEGVYVPPGHGCVGGWAKVYRKDRRVPTTVRIGDEYVRGNNTQWEENRPTMFHKTALIHGLQEAGLCFRLGGTYNRSEMPEHPDLPVEPAFDGPLPPKMLEVYAATPLPDLSPALATEIVEVLEALGYNLEDEEVRDMLAKRKARTIAELTDHDATQLLRSLKGVLDQQNAGEIMLPDPAPQAGGGDPVTSDGEVITEDLPAEEKERLMAKVEGHDGEDAVVLVITEDDVDAGLPEVVENFNLPESEPAEYVPPTDAVRPPAVEPKKRSRKAAKS